MPKNIPILFSTPMVVSIDKDRKTQTRRTTSLKDINKEPERYTLKEFKDGVATFVFNKGKYEFDIIKIKCPYGNVGDLIWVRETWAEINGDIIYKSSGDTMFPPIWKPSIHMSKKHSRIWLSNEGVRIERLLDISDEDCLKEGVYFDKDSGYYFISDAAIIGNTAFEAFESLWIEINGIKSWESNPWVWVIDFKKILKK
jgi:hypothetical protein